MQNLLFKESFNYPEAAHALLELHKEDLIYLGSDTETDFFIMKSKSDEQSLLSLSGNSVFSINKGNDILDSKIRLAFILAKYKGIIDLSDKIEVNSHYLEHICQKIITEGQLDGKFFIRRNFNFFLVRDRIINSTKEFMLNEKEITALSKYLMDNFFYLSAKKLAKYGKQTSIFFSEEEWVEAEKLARTEDNPEHI